MLSLMREKAGGLPAWILSVLAVVVLSVMMLRPVPAATVTLEDGLGAPVSTAGLAF